jgi:signal transduction histidine kinase
VTEHALLGRLRAAARALTRPAGELPPLSLRSQVFDAVLALGLGVVAIQAGARGIEDRPHNVVCPAPIRPGEPTPVCEPPWPLLPPEHEQSTGATTVLLLLVVLPLVFRRRYPLGVLWIVLALATAVSEDSAALRLSFFACVIAGYTAAVYSPYRVPALASLPVAALLHMQLQSDASSVADGAVPFLILLPIAVAADGLRRWKHRADEGQARMSAMEHEQAEALRQATEHERARIARELHDVVTHNVSVMVIQAGGARKIMDSAPDQAREALLAVEASGRSAMTELRHVMGLLTMHGPGPDPAGDADLAPQPGLDGLDGLVQRMRDTGMPIELTRTGHRMPLPPGIELTVYRLVQEALTNIVKHAAGASVTVTLAFGDDDLQVGIADTGGRPGTSAGTGTGRGLLGLRERLAVYGGDLQAGPRLSGGYRVHARIPLEVW